MNCDDTRIDLPVPRRYPGVLTWYGQATRRWWALVPWPSARHGALLIEAADESALADYIARLLGGTAWR